MMTNGTNNVQSADLQQALTGGLIINGSFMSLDDKAADLQTIESLNKRLEMLSQLKNTLLDTLRSKDETILQLASEIKSLQNSLESLTLELKDTREQLERSYK